MPDDLRAPFRQQFDNARDPYTARNALGITGTGGGGGGGGAPLDAQYIVAAADATLTAERVLTDTASVTWDFSTPGQAKANVAASGGGNVSNSGTPTAGQYAKWVTATTIQGVAPAMVLADIGGQPAGSYQPLDADLTAIAALTGTNVIYYRSAADTWAAVTVSTGLSFTGGVLTCTVSTAGSQPLDATLTALAAYNTNGLLTQTAVDTFTGRSIAVPAAGISITNANGVAGNPTLALANDLAALEALAGTNTIYYRSGADAWSAVTFSGLTFSGGVLTAAAGGIKYTASSTAPVGPIAGDLWYDLTTGILAIYINDGTSSQWVQIVAGSGSGSSGDLPSGTLMLFVQTSAPAGWTKNMDNNDRALRVVTGAAASFGSVPFSTLFNRTSVDAFTLTTNEMPTHGHGQVMDSSDSRSPPFWPFSDQYGHVNIDRGATTAAGSSASHAHGIDMRVMTVDCIIAVKD